jgi:hypothetical protein
MRKFNCIILQAFLALTLISHCTTPVTLSTFSKHKKTTALQWPTHGSRSTSTAEDGALPAEEEEAEAVD